jgi:hypothetical protein
LVKRAVCLTDGQDSDGEETENHDNQDQTEEEPEDKETEDQDDLDQTEKEPEDKETEDQDDQDQTRRQRMIKISQRNNLMKKKLKTKLTRAKQSN